MEQKRLNAWDNSFVSGADIFRDSRIVRIPTGDGLRLTQSDSVMRPGEGNPRPFVSDPGKLVYEDFDITSNDEEIKKPVVKNLYEAFLRMDFLDKVIYGLGGKLNSSMFKNIELDKRIINVPSSSFLCE